LRLTVGTPPESVRVTYFMNDVEIGTSESAPWVVWWALMPGDHTLVARAVLRDGQVMESAPIPFSVVEDAPPESRTGD
jgi:hypothetical protein